MTLTADGYLGIGATSPGSPLTVESSAGNQFKITYPSIASYYLNVTSAGALDINKDGSSRLFIDSSGRLLVGTSSARTPLTHSPSLQVEGVGYAPSTISVIGNSNDINGSYIFIGKSRGTSVGSNTIVQSGDEIGGLDFIATDGTQALRAARITSYVDATPGANDMPGRLVFSTTADGAASPTERMRIDNLGYMQGTVNGLSAGRIPAKQYYRLNTARTGSISTTAQSIFGVGVTLVGSTVYEFEGIYHLSGAYTTFPSNCEFHLLFGGTATLNNIMYMGSGPGLIEEYTYVNNYSTSADGFYSTVATSVRVVDIVAADVSVTYFIKGTVSVNAAGTFIPQYRLTQAPTTAFTTRIGSYFSIWPLGASGANTSIGNWA
jgi:hypothetical protein